MPVAKPWTPKVTDEPVEFLGDGWTLWQRSRQPNGGWYNFVLQPPEGLRKKKSAYRGGWNGKRLANSRDMTILAERHAEIYDELERACPSIEWDFDE